MGKSDNAARYGSLFIMPMNFTAPINYGPVNPPTDYQVSTLGPSRQQMLANMLMGQAMEPLQTNQQAGGRTVAINPLSALAKVLQTKMAVDYGNSVDQKLMAAANNQRQRSIEAFAQQFGGAQPGGPQAEQGGYISPSGMDYSRQPEISQQGMPAQGMPNRVESPQDVGRAILMNAAQSGMAPEQVAAQPLWKARYEAALKNAAPTDLQKNIGPQFTPEFQNRYAFKEGFVAPTTLTHNGMMLDPRTQQLLQTNPQPTEGTYYKYEPGNPYPVSSNMIPNAAANQAQVAGGVKKAEQLQEIRPMTVNGRPGIPVSNETAMQMAGTTQMPPGSANTPLPQQNLQMPNVGMQQGFPQVARTLPGMTVNPLSSAQPQNQPDITAYGATPPNPNLRPNANYLYGAPEVTGTWNPAPAPAPMSAGVPTQARAQVATPTPPAAAQPTGPQAAAPQMASTLYPKAADFKGALKMPSVTGMGEPSLVQKGNIENEIKSAEEQQKHYADTADTANRTISTIKQSLDLIPKADMGPGSGALTQLKSILVERFGVPESSFKNTPSANIELTKNLSGIALERGKQIYGSKFTQGESFVMLNQASPSSMQTKVAADFLLRAELAKQQYETQRAQVFNQYIDKGLKPSSFNSWYTQKYPMDKWMQDHVSMALPDWAKQTASQKPGSPNPEIDKLLKLYAPK